MHLRHAYELNEQTREYCICKDLTAERLIALVVVGEAFHSPGMTEGRSLVFWAVLTPSTTVGK